MKRLAIHTILSIFLGCLCTFSGHSQEDGLVIVGNKETVPSELEMDQLVSVLKGEQLRWRDGSRVSIALMKSNTPAGAATCEKIYNMTGNELNKYFLAMVFQGRIKAPTFFNTVSDLETYVSQTPGAIGVLQVTNDENIKVILVDGKKKI